VEWRDSVLVDHEEVTRQVFVLLGRAESLAFALGMRERKQEGEQRADHFVVVRLNDREGWRDWKSKLMFGHGNEVMMRVRVPRRQSAEGTKAFVDVMMDEMRGYGVTCMHKETELMREHGKGYLRPGRKKRKEQRKRKSILDEVDGITDGV
jgi:hypothetical protein